MKTLFLVMTLVLGGCASTHQIAPPVHSQAQAAELQDICMKIDGRKCPDEWIRETLNSKPTEYSSGAPAQPLVIGGPIVIPQTPTPTFNFGGPVVQVPTQQSFVVIQNGQTLFIQQQ